MSEETSKFIFPETLIFRDSSQLKRFEEFKFDYNQVKRLEFLDSDKFDFCYGSKLPGEYFKNRYGHVIAESK